MMHWNKSMLGSGMTPILYFTTFAAVLVLFASSCTIIVWALMKSVRALVGFYRAMTDPEVRSMNKKNRRQLQRLDHLKRAGQ
jgi:hypothetical protein